MPRSVAPVSAYLGALACLACASLGAACGSSSGGETASLDAAAPSSDAGLPESGGDALADAGAPDASTDVMAIDAGTREAGSDAGATFGWPPGRSFPVFPPVTSLDVADVTGVSADEHYLLVSLQGLVNRVSPRIYLQENDAEGATFWLDMLKVPTTPVANPITLVSKYASVVKGMVIYDPALLDTVNLATTIAAIESVVVVSPTLAPTFAAPPYNLPTLVDLRTMGFANANAVYEYELATYGTRATNRIIMGLNPGIADCLRDYAVAAGAMVVWLDSTDMTQASILGGFLSGLERNAPYMGWWVDEPSGVSTASRYGVPVFAADFSRNLTVLSAVPRTITPPTPPPPPALENKAYVAIFMSDGDNVQEDQHLIPLKWADKARGQVPISWTVSPSLVDIAPVILDYFDRTATPDDVLVSGPSGLGYTYPQSWPVLAFTDYTKRSADALARSGLSVITVWNNGEILTASPQAVDYASDMPHLLGVTDQLGTGGPPTLISGTMPLLVFSQGYAGSETDLESGIDGALKGWTGGSPLFVAVQGDMNQGAITPSTFLAVQQHYASNAQVTFVRGDHLFQLIRKSQGLPTSP